MDPFESWTLEAIRSEGAWLSWLEELRFDWLPSTQHAISQILSAKSIVLITDSEHNWFEAYILNALNDPMLQRPMIPITSLDGIFPQYDYVRGKEVNSMVEDMLSISYKNEYFFWYIGKGEDPRADIAKRSESSYLWTIDETSNFVPLASYDPQIDIKLIQLYQLFDKSLSAVLFGETTLEQ